MPDSFEQLSNKELEVGYWWTLHRVKIKAIGFIIIIVALLAIYVNAGWRGYQYIKGTAAHQEMLKELSANYINYNQIKQASGPASLEIGNVQVLSGSQSGFYNLVVSVTNVNQRWWLKEIRYQFEVDGDLTDENVAFILPGEKKYVFYFNHESVAKPASVRLVVKRETWYRIKDKTKLDSQRKWIEPPFIVNSLIYTSGIAENSQSEVSFNLRNDSIYSFWQIGLQILLWQGQRLVDFNSINLTDVEVGSIRAVEVLMNKNLPGGLRPEVIVSANNLDEGNLSIFNASPSFIH